MNKFKYNENDINSRYRAARKENCPVDVLAILADDKVWAVRYAVKNNPNCPADLREKIELKEKDLQARRDFAGSQDRSIDELVKLDKDEDSEVRRAVARNINCPPDLLMKLASDANIRPTIAHRANCPATVLASLVGCEPDVRREVAKNRNCPAEALIKLAGDRDYKVRRFVAENPNCSIDALAKLSKSKSADIRMAVANNPNCTAALLTKLSSDLAMCVRCAVADNPGCPIVLLETLATDESCFVRYAVADNPNCTGELRRIALAGGHSSPAVAMHHTHLKNLPKILKPLRERIESTMKPFVDIQMDDPYDEEAILFKRDEFDKKLRLWQSKVGGFPYFPKGNEYPVDPNGKPLLLLVQINFADVPELDMFPEKGILQIYLGDAENYYYGKNIDDGMDQSYFRVLYFPEVIDDRDALVTDFEFLPTDRSYLPCSDIVPIRFDLKYEPISKGDYRFDQMILNGRDEDDIYEIREAYSEKFSGYGSKLGGYPEFVQGDPRESYQCFPAIKLDHGIWKMKMDEAGWKGEGSDFEFILLLQLDDGFTWGDCGIGNFFIRKIDLLNRDFSKVLYDWSCY